MHTYGCAYLDGCAFLWSRRTEAKLAPSVTHRGASVVSCASMMPGMYAGLASPGFFVRWLGCQWDLAGSSGGAALLAPRSHNSHLFQMIQMAVASPLFVWSESALPLSCTSNVRISRWRCLPLVTKHRSPGSFVRHAPLRACCVLYTRRVALLCPVHVVR
jgi:hypothetical protein